MKRTLLDLTQNILSSLSSDEVNSISDTTESMQVAEIIKTTYFNIISRVKLTSHNQLIQLDPSLDTTTPVLMYVPDGIGKIEWLKYFNSNTHPDSDISGHGVNTDIIPTDEDNNLAAPGYEYVTILPIKQFIDTINQLNPNNANVETFIFNDTSNNYNGTYTFYYKTDKQPTLCTILSNYYVIFDSYDSAVDDTLQNSKTMALGLVIPVWRMEDNFIPNLEDEQVNLLLNEAKSLAFFELKQMVHSKAEQEAKRGWTSIQKNKSTIERPTDFDALPDFGRRGVYDYTSRKYR